MLAAKHHEAGTSRDAHRGRGGRGQEKSNLPQARACGQGPSALAEGAQANNTIWSGLALAVQPKLWLSSSGDPDEREADRVADALLASSDLPSISRANPETQIARKCSACESGGGLCPACAGDQRIQRQQDGSTGKHVTADNFTARLTGGSALPRQERQFFETRMGRDLGDVRIHTGASAHASAQSIGARAYTLGNNIAFAQGEFAPDSERGRHLLAHELTHVVQQSGGNQSIQRAPGPRAAEIERSRTSPGRVTGTASPPFFSLYNFAINDSTLKTRHYDFLDEFAHLVYIGAITNVRLQGHADSTGDDDINGPLSNARAQSVESYLALLGVSVASSGGAAASSPVLSNSSEAGRSRNRRVDISFDLVGIPVPVPEPEDGDTERPPPEDTEPPPGFDWPDIEFPCFEHPIICGIIGVGVFCFFYPQICVRGIPWPGIPWPDIPWPDWPGGDGDEEPEPPEQEPEEPESELNCGDPGLPLTHVTYIPPSGDKGNRVVAEPLTRCEGNKHGSNAKRWDANWPHGWDCVRQRHQSHLWARAHLLHGPNLHGPGNERENIIIADKSINGKMSARVEQPAITRVNASETLWYEVTANHMTGDYPRPYFAASMGMRYGLLDPITRVRGPAIFDGTIDSDTHRVPPECDSTVVPPDDTTPPEPTPEDETPGPAQEEDNLPCDREALARGVDACVEEARQGAIDCTLGLLPFSGGWGGVGGSIEYLRCLRAMRQRLIECDRQVKEDTHCPDSPAPEPPAPEQRDDSFDSTLQICLRLLDSRVFHVASGRLDVVIDANWLTASGSAVGPDQCPTGNYHVSLEKVGLLFDSEIGTVHLPPGTPMRVTWSSLEPGDYYLKIWTNNMNPNCCLTGTISVSTARPTMA